MWLAVTWVSRASARSASAARPSSACERIYKTVKEQIGIYKTVKCKRQSHIMRIYKTVSHKRIYRHTKESQGQIISGKVLDTVRSRGAFQVKVLGTFRVAQSSLGSGRPLHFITFQDAVQVIIQRKKRRPRGIKGAPEASPLVGFLALPDPG